MVGHELEVYDPGADKWQVLAPMAVPRNHTAGGAIGGRFYVVGGRGSPTASTAHEAYDPTTNTWTTRPLPTVPASPPASSATASACSARRSLGSWRGQV
jgi:N-acetylneuraminic acid mutarotase